MGWIHPGNPAEQLHKLAGKVEVDRAHVQHTSDSKPSPTTPTPTKMEETPTYSFQPKKTVDKDLPFIAASEVQKQDGKDGKKLRTHLHLHNHSPAHSPTS